MRQVTKLVKRAPEEELMDLPAHAQAYANADSQSRIRSLSLSFRRDFPDLTASEF
jgi:hypothetical protein